MTPPAARYGPGETRTLATDGRFSARSRSSLTPARAADYLVLSFRSSSPNDLVGAIDRQLYSESASRSAGFSVTQVSQLNESLRGAARIGKSGDRKARKPHKNARWFLLRNGVDC